MTSNRDSGRLISDATAEGLGLGPDWNAKKEFLPPLDAIPEGKRIRGRVKEVLGVESWPEQVHPKRKHPWREMLHDGEPGTGFAQCICGAVGVPYRWPR